MGIWDTITDLVEAATPWSTAEAEAPPAKESTSQGATETEDDSKPAEESSDDSSEGKEEGTEDEPEEEADDEEEEEEEEVQDPKVKLEEECKSSKQCSPAKHHFEECVERVENGSKEDCVEEFFHLTHCATQCAAPKLWAILK